MGLPAASSCCACACCVGAVGRSFAATSPASVGTFGGEGLPTLLELGTDPMTRIGESVWVARIAPLLWLHTTTATIEGGYVFPANGLIVERPSLWLSRYFGGLSVEETAEALGVAARTVKLDWAMAKGWLKSQLSTGAGV